MLTFRLAGVVLLTLVICSTARAQYYAEVICRYPGGTVGGVDRKQRFSDLSRCQAALRASQRSNPDSRYCSYRCVGSSAKRRSSSGASSQSSAGAALSAAGSLLQMMSEMDSGSSSSPGPKKWGKYGTNQKEKWVANEDYQKAIQAARRLAKAVDQDYLRNHLPNP